MFELAKQYMEQGDKDVVKKRKIELEAAIGSGTVKPADHAKASSMAEKVEDEKPKDSDTIALKPAINKTTTENSAKPPQKKLKIVAALSVSTILGKSSVRSAAQVQCVALPSVCPMERSRAGKISEMKTQITAPAPTRAAEQSSVTPGGRSISV